MINPYSGLPNHHFWRRSASSIEAHLFDPVVRTRFRISASDKVATAGSCFAQHIARRLRQWGNNYFVVEDGARLSEAERTAGQYGLFSARYGNIYTAAQLWQLWREAYGVWEPAQRAWQREDGRWVDPFRPAVEPDCFDDPRSVIAARTLHLSAVRSLFETCDVMVFTLGLTEAWRARADGAVYPLAPGVAGGCFDPEHHIFANFNCAEVEEALVLFLDAVKARNPHLRVILTVSPVPLAATYEDRSVLVSTTYSKAVLRVAAEMITQRFDWVDYFPSFEIITGSPTSGLYYEDDAREVNALGVAHVMRLFRQHYLSEVAPNPAALTQADIAVTGTEGVICDEALIEATTRAGG